MGWVTTFLPYAIIWHSNINDLLSMQVWVSIFIHFANISSTLKISSALCYFNHRFSWCVYGTYFFLKNTGKSHYSTKSFHMAVWTPNSIAHISNEGVMDHKICNVCPSVRAGLQKMFSLSGTFKSNGQNFLPNMCAKRTSRARSAKSLWPVWPGSRARLRALEGCAF